MSNIDRREAVARGREPGVGEFDRNAALVRLMADDGVNLEYCRELAKKELARADAAPLLQDKEK